MTTNKLDFRLADNYTPFLRDCIGNSIRKGKVFDMTATTGKSMLISFVTYFLRESLTY